jgi:hypothetical protein
VIWWAVAVDNEAVGEVRRDPLGVPLPSWAPNEKLVRSAQLTHSQNGFVGLRCSAKAENSDSAVRLALDYTSGTWANDPSKSPGLPPSQNEISTRDSELNCRDKGRSPNYVGRALHRSGQATQAKACDAGRFTQPYPQQSNALDSNAVGVSPLLCWQCFDKASRWSLLHPPEWAPTSSFPPRDRAEHREGR